MKCKYCHLVLFIYHKRTISMNEMDERNGEEISSSSFSHACGEISMIEDEIEEQTKQIQVFIQEHNKKHNKSETHMMLEKLYDLFVTESRLNFIYRRDIINNKHKNAKHLQKNQAFSQNYKQFIEEMQGLTGRKFDDVDELNEFLSKQHELYSQVTMTTNALIQMTQLQNHYSELIGTTKGKISFLKQRIEEYQAQNTIESAEIISKIENSSQLIQKYKSQMLDLQVDKADYQFKMNKVKEKSDIYQKQIQSQMNEFQQTISDFRALNSVRVIEKNEIKQQVKELAMKRNLIENELKIFETAYDSALQEQANIMSKLEDEQKSSITQIGEIKRSLKNINNALNKVNSQKAIFELNYNDLKTQYEKKNKMINELVSKTSNLQIQSTEIFQKLRDLQTNEKLMNQEKTGMSETDMIEKSNYLLMIENAKLESQIRVKISEINQLESKNQSYASKIQSLRQEIIEINQIVKMSSQKEQHQEDVIKSVFKDFETLKQGLKFNHNVSPSEVAEYIIKNFAQEQSSDAETVYSKNEETNYQLISLHKELDELNLELDESLAS